MRAYGVLWSYLFCKRWKQVGSRRAVDDYGYNTARNDEKCRMDEVSKREGLLLAIDDHAKIRAY